MSSALEQRKDVDPLSLPPVQLGMQDSHGFVLAQRVATLFSKSTLVPTQYQGNISNCFIALNMANRMKADPLMIIQNLYLVHGRPSWSAQFMIALFNQNERFTSLLYRPIGEKGTDSFGYVAYSSIKETGEVLEGPEITIELAKENGWWSKKDRHGNESSKWPVMTDMMLRYRAASWFIRLYAPELSMGLQTAEEVRDTYDMEPVGDSYVVPVRGEVSTDLNAIIEVQHGSESVQGEVASDDNAGNAERGNADQKRKRKSQEELEMMRVDLVDAIISEGLEVSEVEKAAGEFSNRWSEKAMDRIENIILPNMRAERAGA